jgi:hypothetical protein
VLIYPDFTKTFILETDASTVGLGAVLAQKDNNGLNRPIGYGSRMLKDAVKNYSATELETLSVVWACEQFRPYLYGRKFVIECDHNPLVFNYNMKNKTSRVSRLRYNLSEFQYRIEYVKGSLNVKADALSRAVILSVESITSQIIEALKIIEASKDENLSEIKQHPPTNFFVENGILFKKRMSGIE